jgi:hypothetical protein
MGSNVQDWKTFLKSGRELIGSGAEYSGFEIA